MRAVEGCGGSFFPTPRAGLSGFWREPECGVAEFAQVCGSSGAAACAPPPGSGSSRPPRQRPCGSRPGPGELGVRPRRVAPLPGRARSVQPSTTNSASSPARRPPSPAPEPPPRRRPDLTLPHTFRRPANVRPSGRVARTYHLSASMHTLHGVKPSSRASVRVSSSVLCSVTSRQFLR